MPQHPRLKRESNVSILIYALTVLLLSLLFDAFVCLFLGCLFVLGLLLLLLLFWGWFVVVVVGLCLLLFSVWGLFVCCCFVVVVLFLWVLLLLLFQGWGGGGLFVLSFVTLSLSVTGPSFFYVHLSFAR